MRSKSIAFRASSRAALAHDDVAVHGNAQRLYEVDDGFRHLDIGLRGKGSPDGRLCVRMRAVADNSSARLFTSRGQTGVEGRRSPAPEQLPFELFSHLERPRQESRKFDGALT